MSKTRNRFSSEVRGRAVRMVNGGVKMYRRGGAKVSHGLGGSLSR